MTSTWMVFIEIQRLEMTLSTFSKKEAVVGLLLQTRIEHRRVKMQTAGKRWTALVKQKLWWSLSARPWNCCNRVKVSEHCTFYLPFPKNSPCAFKRVTLQTKYRCCKTLSNNKKTVGGIKVFTSALTLPPSEPSVGIATRRCRCKCVWVTLSWVTLLSSNKKWAVCPT